MKRFAVLVVAFLIFQQGRMEAGILSTYKPASGNFALKVQRLGPTGSKTTEMMIESGLSKWAKEWDALDKDMLYARAQISLERLIEVYPYIPKQSLATFRAKVLEFEKTRCRPGTKGCYD